jgi:general secretion pathway protein N
MKRPTFKTRLGQHKPAHRRAAGSGFKGRRYAWLGACLGLLLSTVYFAPASWLAATLKEASKGHVILAGAQGTVWQGNAQLELGGGIGSDDRTALPGTVKWQLRPTWSGLRMQVNASCCTPQDLQADLSPRWGGAKIEVANGLSTWPAALLAGLGTPWNTLQPEGSLKLSTQALHIEWVEGRLRVAGTAQVEALQMASRLSTLRPMGSYRLNLTGGQVTALNLETLEGSLRLNGNGQWAGSRLHFQGFAEAEPEREAALANLLNIIGRREGARSIITVG